MRALRDRPTTLERWPKGVQPGIVLSTRELERRRRVLPEARPERRAGLRARRRASSSPPAATPTRSARRRSRSSAGRRRWARSRSIPWPVRATTSTTPTSCGSTSIPQPGTDFADAVRVAATARELLDELGYAGFPKTSGGRGVHIYVRIEPRWTFTDVRHAAIAFGRELERRLPGEVTTKWWKEERGARIFVDYNQNARDRTIASAYSIRPKPGAPVSAPVDWDELAEVAARGLHRRDDAGALRRGRRPPRRDRRRRALAAAAARALRGRRRRATCPTRPTTRRCRASRSACSPRAIAIDRARRDGVERLVDHLVGAQRLEAVADAEVRVDVAPVRRAALELRAQLAHEHVDRAVAARHRVAPHVLVDRLALQHAALRRRPAAGASRTRAASGRGCARRRTPGTVAADLELAGVDPRPALRAGAARRRRRTIASIRAISSSG